jgi:hypothetical protein
MQALVRSLFDPKRMFAGILFLGIFILAARNITDPDFWWHLRTGQYILDTHSVPRADPFSFTRLGHPWIAHEWLSEVLIYSIYRVASWGGLIVVFAAVPSLTFIFLYLRCAGRPYVAGLLVLWAAFVCRPTWGVRPQTMSVLLASLLLWMLERPNLTRRTLMWVVPLTLLWANLHAGYSLGIALLVLFLLGGWLDSIFGFTGWSEVRAETRWLFLTLLLSLAVVVFNPNGWRLYGYPFATLHSTTMQKDIAEWFSPDFHRGEYLPLAAMLVAAVAFPYLSRQRMRPRTMLLVCVSAYAALQSVRLIPIFALIAAPFLTEHAEAFLQSLKWSIGPRKSRSLNASRLARHGAIAIGLIVLASLQLRQIIKRQPAAEAAAFPEAAVSFLHDHHQPGPLFNDYDWGGYLIWHLYPGDRVFIDGRADLYGDQFLDEYAAAYDLTGDWQKPLNRWQIGAVVVPPQSALATALQATGTWKVLFRDRQATILARSDPSMKVESAPSPGVVPSTNGESREPAPERSISTLRGPRN